MKILRKKLTRAEFSQYVQEKDFGTVRPNTLVIHHTYRPTVESWSGERTIDGLKHYYEGLGWAAGPHIFVAPDGIWLFTDMKDVGIHAGSGNATWVRAGKELHGYHYRFAKLKSYSLGIEVVGNYDEKVWEDDVRLNALSCIATLKKRLGLHQEDLTFHNEYSPKSCPGNAITKSWLYEQLDRYEREHVETNGYQMQFSPEEAKRAIELGFLKHIDSEQRELLGIGLVRVYDRIKRELG